MVLEAQTELWNRPLLYTVTNSHYVSVEIDRTVLETPQRRFSDLVRSVFAIATQMQRGGEIHWYTIAQLHTSLSNLRYFPKTRKFSKKTRPTCNLKYQNFLCKSYALVFTGISNHILNVHFWRFPDTFDKLWRLPMCGWVVYKINYHNPFPFLLIRSPSSQYLPLCIQYKWLVKNDDRCGFEFVWKSSEMDVWDMIRNPYEDEIITLTNKKVVLF